MAEKVKKDIFLKVKRLVGAEPGQVLLLENLAEVVADKDLQSELEKIEIKTVNKEPGKSMVITALEIISAIKQQFPEAEIDHLGEADVVVDIEEDCNSTEGINDDNPPKWLVFIVGLILFLGSGMAIMNFHADVSMSKVHQQIYKLVMGETNQYPLLLQIPYSLGIACGMIIFFNGFFGFDFDDDPSPLEIEMYLYEDKVNRFSLHQKTQQAKKNNQ